MSMWTAKEKSLNYDQAKAEAARAQKDIKMVKKFVQSTVFQFNEYVITTLVKWTDRFLITGYFYDQSGGCWPYFSPWH